MIDHDAPWTLEADCAERVPAALREWLGEPGLLSERVRIASGGAARFRLLCEGPAVLSPGAQRCLGVTDDEAHHRHGEFHLDGERWIATLSVFPRSTLEHHPWLVAIGGALLGERLKRVALIAREPFEYLELPDGHPLSRIPRDPVRRPGPSGRAWARRAVHRIDGAPILITEAFRPDLPAAAAAAPP